jgi:hypothetical protein
MHSDADDERTPVGLPDDDLPEPDRVRPRVLMYADMSETGHSKEDHYYAAEVNSGFSPEKHIVTGPVRKVSLGYAEFPAIERAGSKFDLESFIEEVEEKALWVAWKDDEVLEEVR